jgi:hypothetical protein
MLETQRFPTFCFQLTLFAFVLVVFASPAAAQEAIDLKVNFKKGSQNRVVCDFLHSGTVTIPKEETGEIVSLPLSVDAKLSFYQRTTSDDQTIRFFEKASGRIKLDRGTTKPELSPANQLIVARLREKGGDQVELASMTGILDQVELELIQNPADPMTLSAVFSRQSVKEGDSWAPSVESLAKMLRLHRIEESKVRILLKKYDSKSARVYIIGTLLADVNDVVTEMELSGIAMIDRENDSLSSLKLTIRERRGPGQIAPGFDGKTKIDIRITDAATDKLSNEALAKYTGKDNKIRQRVRWQCESGNFSVTYEPRWKMIASEQDAAVLRFIDGSELLAQCNIVQLPSRPADNPLSLEDYKTEVAKIIAADENAVLLAASSLPTLAGDMAMQVVVGGEEEGVPVNWLYYHVTHEDGRRVTLVFTLAESVAQRVDPIAAQLVNEFEFEPVPKKIASKKPEVTETK